MIPPVKSYRHWAPRQSFLLPPSPLEGRHGMGAWTGTEFVVVGGSGADLASGIPVFAERSRALLRDGSPGSLAAAVDRNGGLIYVAGPGLSVNQLAELFLRAGAVRAKLAELGAREEGVVTAVAWARRAPRKTRR